MKSLLPLSLLSLLLAFYADLSPASGAVLDPITGVTASSPANAGADQLVGAAGGNFDLVAGASTVLGASDSLANGNSYPGNTYYAPGSTITFDLGATYSVSDLLVWNNTQNDFQDFGAQSVEILSSATGAPLSFTLVTTTTFNEVPFGSTNNTYATAPAQIISVSIPDAKYIELIPLSNYAIVERNIAYGGVIGLNVVNFVGPEVVPEPSTYAMMLVGLALLGFCVRRKLA
jgi:hypothetical protein